MGPPPDAIPRAAPSGNRARRSWARLRQLFESDIWDYGIGGEPSLKGHWIALLRILSISWSGLLRNGLFTRAAALSYSSLLALGPLVAVVVIFSSSFIQTNAETQIKRVLLFIAPSLKEMLALDGSPPTGAESEMANALDALLSQIVTGAESLLNQVDTTGSTLFGAMGSLIFIWIVIQLLTSVETTLNQIWGVHQGRPWSQRIVFYWTFVTLGALLGLGSAALFSASNIIAMLDWVPFGSEMARLAFRFTPLLSYAMLVLLLTLFYRFFPNTSVAFRPALAGSALTALLLFLNNYLSILYVQRVISFQSLYGSVGIVPVLMIGLYFFWVLILLGGQLTYAVQNVHFLTHQDAWQRSSPLARELVTLAAFLMIARRFHACEPPPTVEDISARLHVPVNILNESLGTLQRLDWIARVTLDEPRAELKRAAYRPSKPLAAYNLSRFRHALENFGRSDMLGSLLRDDPLLKTYAEALRWHEQDPLCQTALPQLLDRNA